MDFDEVLRALWLEWFDAATPDIEPASEPAVLTELRVISQDRDVFGHQNHLLPPSSPNDAGVVPVVGENQGCWTLGYRVDTHMGVLYDTRTEVERPFPELLYRASAEEAVFSGTWHMGDADRSEVDRVLGPHLVVEPLQEGDVGLPGVWQPDGLLVMAFAPPRPRSELGLWAASRDAEGFGTTIAFPLATWRSEQL